MTLDPIHGKYPPVAIEITDASNGEVKRIELDYRRLTIPKAYEWLRGMAYFMEAVYAWRMMLERVTREDARSIAEGLPMSLRRDAAVEEMTADGKLSEAKAQLSEAKVGGPK